MPSGALKIEGREISIDDALEIVLQDEIFYRGKGGLTLSGGEPLAQEASVKLLKRAKEEHLNTAVESCGLVPTQRLLDAAAYLDEIFFDIKSLNPEKHKEYTGVSNERILSNLKELKMAYPEKKIRVRTPVIPSFNDTQEELDAIEKFLKNHRDYRLGKASLPHLWRREIRNARQGISTPHKGKCINRTVPRKKTHRHFFCSP